MVQLHYNTAPLQYSSTTIQLHYNTDPLQYSSTTIQPHYDTAPLWYSSTTIQLHYNTAPLQYSPTMIQPHYGTAPLQYSSTTIQLHYNTAPLWYSSRYMYTCGYGIQYKSDLVHTHLIIPAQEKIQLNLSIMNPGYNELPDITNIDLRMYTYLLYCK